VVRADSQEVQCFVLMWDEGQIEKMTREAVMVNLWEFLWLEVSGSAALLRTVSAALLRTVALTVGLSGRTCLPRCLVEATLLSALVRKSPRAGLLTTCRGLNSAKMKMHAKGR